MGPHCEFNNSILWLEQVKILAVLEMTNETRTRFSNFPLNVKHTRTASAPSCSLICEAIFSYHATYYWKQVWASRSHWILFLHLQKSISPGYVCDQPWYTEEYKCGAFFFFLESLGVKNLFKKDRIFGSEGAELKSYLHHLLTVSPLMLSKMSHFCIKWRY